MTDADQIRHARERLRLAKASFAWAAKLALADAPNAVEQVSQALKEIDQARGELRLAEQNARAAA